VVVFTSLQVTFLGFIVLPSSCCTYTGSFFLPFCSGPLLFYFSVKLAVVAYGTPAPPPHYEFLSVTCVLPLPGGQAFLRYEILVLTRSV